METATDRKNAWGVLIRNCKKVCVGVQQAAKSPYEDDKPSQSSSKESAVQIESIHPPNRRFWRRPFGREGLVTQTRSLYMRVTKPYRCALDCKIVKETCFLQSKNESVP